MGSNRRFLYQMDYLGEEDYTPNPVLEKALDVLFLLHADHELNASATTVLQTGSSLVDPYSAIASVVKNSFPSILPDLISYLGLAALLSSEYGLIISKSSSEMESWSLSGPLHGVWLENNVSQSI